MSDISQRIAALSPQKRALVALRLKQRGGDFNIFPLSFSQERLWFLDQWEPGNPFYNVPGVTRLLGQLDVSLFVKSLKAIVRRHEILRTTFATLDGQPMQIVAPDLALMPFLADLTGLRSNERMAEARQQASAEARAPFDLQRGPLVRVRLLRLDARDHMLLVTMHHIVSDGWSLGIFNQELGALYAAYSREEPSPLVPLPIQYADYALWQRQSAQSAALERQLTYWRRHLAGAPTILELPPDYPRPAVWSSHGAHVSFTLSPVLGQQLQTASRKAGATLFMALLTAFQIVLARYSGQEDVVVGSPVAGRTRAETEGLIGFFVNVLILRADLSGNPTWREALERTREVVLSAFTHQDISFEKLVEALAPTRDLSHTPLVQVLFALQNTPMPPLELEGLQVEELEEDSDAARFDLSLTMAESEGRLDGLLRYNTDLFDAARIIRMANHFQALLEGVVENPGQRIAALPLLTTRERQQLLVEWNAAPDLHPGEVYLPQLIEDQVARLPDTIAVVYEEHQITYLELNTRVNRLAHYLRERQVGPDVLVGLCMERSPEQIIGLIGILKAGGAYVPLDPAYPKERLAFMLADAGCPLLITREDERDQLPEQEARAIFLDTDWPAISQEPATNPVRHITTRNLAYAIYTSGSTGKPKGVPVEHRQVQYYISAVLRHLALGVCSSFAMVQPLTFDSSITVLFSSLCTGGQLHLITRERASDPLAFSEYLATRPIDCLKITPSHLAALQAGKDPGQAMPRLRLIVGGEASHLDWVRSLCDLAPACAIFNHYGPTETTVGVSYYPVESAHSKPGFALTPLGRAFNGTETYILDAHLQPVPLGVPGQLYLGGQGLARGYLHRPDLTAESFIPHPFSTTPGMRLYKTGDLARYRKDDYTRAEHYPLEPSRDHYVLEFLGRIDHQVKLHGYRIEPGEIETLLGQHPLVREAVVVVREDRLVAYLVAEREQALQVSELRWHLLTRLPEYMVPTVFVALTEVPRTPHGKVDHPALPMPDEATAQIRQTYVPPRTPVEELLAVIWASVLRIERVGVHDNFFELGGDSIISIQIIARAHQLQLHLTPRQVFQYQTIAELATVASIISTTGAEQGVVTGRVLLTPIQHYFFGQDLPEPHHYNQALLLELTHPLDAVLFEQAITHILIHHDALRLRFRRISGEWQQINEGLEGIEMAEIFRRIDLSSQADSEQNSTIETIAARTQASLDLSAGPLIRVVLFDRGPLSNMQVLLVIHHLTIDGVSWRILVEDVATVYQQLRQGLEARLPSKTTSFQQWALQLREYAQSVERNHELAYWSAKPFTERSPLPTDFPEGREANTEDSAYTVEVALSIEETRMLIQDVPQAYHTQINDVLLTALARTFSGWTGRHTLLLDLEGHGREVLSNTMDLSRTVGWFTTLFPVVLDLKKATGPGEALKAIKEQLRLIPGRGISYGALRYLSEKAEIIELLRTLPRAEVRFNYLGQFDQMTEQTSLFVLSQESCGPLHSPRGRRSHLLDINGLIVGGQLLVNWTYSRQVHLHSTIIGLAGRFRETLQTIIAHCLSPEAGGYTPSDFSAKRLKQRDLDRFLKQIGQREGKRPN